MNKTLIVLIICFTCIDLQAQHSVARLWNEEVLVAIRNDFARPTVHARNLFHLSFGMYDAWAIYQPDADTYFLGKTVQGYTSEIEPIAKPYDRVAAQEQAISYVAYRLIEHRFVNAPRYNRIMNNIDRLMEQLGYDINITSTDYHCSAAGLGNYLAQQIIEYGLQDGANEANDYTNLYYEPVNPPLRIEVPGNPNIVDLNRWQPLELEEFIDQAGNPIGDDIPEFLMPKF